jgi:hypothetical protein
MELRKECTIVDGHAHEREGKGSKLLVWSSLMRRDAFAHGMRMDMGIMNGSTFNTCRYLGKRGSSVSFRNGSHLTLMQREYSSTYGLARELIGTIEQAEIPHQSSSRPALV